MRKEKIVLTFWDLLQYKIWDKACEVKGFGKDFRFGSVYENDYHFEFTGEELKRLGLSSNN